MIAWNPEQHPTTLQHFVPGPTYLLETIVVVTTSSCGNESPVHCANYRNKNITMTQIIVSRAKILADPSLEHMRDNL